jgi:hypothetical protein
MSTIFFYDFCDSQNGILTRLFKRKKKKQVTRFGNKKKKKKKKINQTFFLIPISHHSGWHGSTLQTKQKPYL